MKKLVTLLAATALSLGFGAGIAQATHGDGPGGPTGCGTTEVGEPSGDAHGVICGDADGDGNSEVYVGGNAETLCGEIWVGGEKLADSEDNDPTTVNEPGTGDENADECD